MGVISKLIGAGLKKTASKTAAPKELARRKQTALDGIKRMKEQINNPTTMTKAGAQERLAIYKKNLKDLSKPTGLGGAKPKIKNKPKVKEHLTTDPITRKKYEVGTKVINKVKKLADKKKSTTAKSPGYKEYLTTDPITRKKYEVGTKALNLIKAGIDKVKKGKK